MTILFLGFLSGLNLTFWSERNLGSEMHLELIDTSSYIGSTLNSNQ